MGKSLQDYGREWLDTLVVAISVAMAFRAYFFEPFNIPTGSMQPTLYGNHSEPCKEPGIFEKTPLKWLNWAISGRDYKEFVAPVSGVPVIEDRTDGRFNLFVSSPSGVGGKVTLPTDAAAGLNFGEAYAGVPVAPYPRRDGRRSFRVRNPDGSPGPEVRVKAGTLMWRGYDTTGDFIFVNRWKWNFRRPERGDVMVFATTGIPALVQGTHYIKRLTALPGETVEIVKPDVYIDGVKIAPLKPAKGRRGEPTPEPNAGGDRAAPGPAKMGEGEYFACGDNSDNSFDSRYWGPVPERNLRGTGACVFWPLANARWGMIR